MTFHPRLQRRFSRRARQDNVVRGHLAASKTNPYVGWFRHAPPSKNAKSMKPQFLMRGVDLTWDVTAAKLYASKSLGQQKTSPFVGFFRHAPPTMLASTVSFRRTCEAFLTEANRKALLMNLIDGRLKGGAPGNGLPRKWIEDGMTLPGSLRQALHESGKASDSGTVQVLSRLATWMLAPLDPNPTGYGNTLKSLPQTKYEDEHDVEESSCGSSVSSEGTVLPRDRYEGVNGYVEHEISTITIDRSVSSLAEGYYAHLESGQNTSLLRSRSSSTLTTNGDLDDPHRLDFVITQMDIARMARNASRHLDVDSILSLPTITYHLEDTESARTDRDASYIGSESWMIVPLSDQSKEESKCDETCVICLETFQEGDKLRVLPCDHRFHVQCVDKWLSGSHSFGDCFTSGCPTCKKEPVTNSRSSMKSQGSSLDGSVPSWAFARLGGVLASSTSSVR